MSDLSWLNPTPHALAVYASRLLSPAVTQHSLPTGRCPLLGPDFHRLDRTSLPGARSGRDVRFIARPPHRSVRAAFPHTACMGLLLSRGHHTVFCRAVASFFCSTRAASILPSRPHITIAVARSEGQGRRFFSAAEGLSLTIASTAAGCPRSGGRPRNDPRGACHWPRAIARTTLVFG